MNKIMFCALGVLCAAGASSAAVTTINGQPNNVDIASFTAAELGFAPTPIDLSGQPIAQTLTGANNTLVSDFTGVLGSTTFYSGRLTSEVFANAGSVGPAVTDVVIKYTFELFSGSINAVDAFEFGVNTGINLDAAALIGATQGRVADEVFNQGSDPVVTVNDASNVLYTFDFAAATDVLAAGDTFSWYVQQTGAVSVNAVEVAVTDAVNSNAFALSFVNDPGQEDLNVPTPGSAALLGLAGMAAIRRRRK